MTALASMSILRNMLIIFPIFPLLSLFIFLFFLFLCEEKSFGSKKNLGVGWQLTLLGVRPNFPPNQKLLNF